MIGLSGTYEMYRTENFFDFLVACGAPAEKASSIVEASCIQHIEERENTIGVKIDSNHPFLNTPGMKEFSLTGHWEDMEDMHGKPVQYMSTIEDNQIVHRFKDENGDILTSKRIKTSEGMKLELEKFGVESVHFFKASK